MDKSGLVFPVPGCIFKYNGKIPESAYTPTSFESPMEKAIYENDNNALKQLIENGHQVTVHLKIGEMSCFEYASLKGYKDLLSNLLENSASKEVVKKYFHLEDMTERARMISNDKESFFGPLSAMMEINRYIASLYNAIAFNRTDCLRLLLEILGKKDLLDLKLTFGTTEAFNAINLAQYLGHQDCLDIINCRLARE